LISYAQASAQSGFLTLFDADTSLSEMVAFIALSVCARGSNAAISHDYRWTYGIQVDDEIYFAGISRFHCDGEAMQETTLARSIHHRTFCRPAIHVFGIVFPGVLGRINGELYRVPIFALPFARACTHTTSQN
jgi:hypothetical protein